MQESPQLGIVLTVGSLASRILSLYAQVLAIRILPRNR